MVATDTSFSNRIKVKDAERTLIHATSEKGNYDTLCGLDANDTGRGVETRTIGYSRKRINCPDCKAAWADAKRFVKKDFV